MSLGLKPCVVLDIYLMAELTSWLNHQLSLMDKLKAVASDVHLEVLRHDWSHPDSWDQQKLKILTKNPLLRREIIMWASAHACWYARTIIPHATYNVEDALFKQLSTEPLGELIWNHPHFKRQSMTSYLIDKESPEYHFLTPELHQNTHTLWARLSTISVHETSFMYLLEIFLPDLCHYL